MLQIYHLGDLMKKFVLYVPGATLEEIHRRTSWIMLPLSFSQIGYESHIICERFKLTERHNFTVHEIFKRKRNLFVSLIEPFFAFRILLKEKPTVVLISPFSYYLISILPLIFIFRIMSKAKHRNVGKMILKLDWSLDYFGMGLLKILFSKFFVGISTFLFDKVSTETYCGLERATGIPLTKKGVLCRVPVGYPQGFLLSIDSTKSYKKPIILCVGRIARMKGQDILIKAFSKVASKHNEWSVRLVGPAENQEFKRELNLLINDLNLSKCVTFYDFVKEETLYSMYKEASIFCLPSVSKESWGNVKSEAIAYGLPVLTTDVPCRADAEEMGCITSRAGNVDELAENLELLISDSNLRNKIAIESQRKLITYLDIARIYDSL